MDDPSSDEPSSPESTILREQEEFMSKRTKPVSKQSEVNRTVVSGYGSRHDASGPGSNPGCPQFYNSHWWNFDFSPETLMNLFSVTWNSDGAGLRESSTREETKQFSKEKHNIPKTTALRPKDTKMDGCRWVWVCLRLREGPGSITSGPQFWHFLLLKVWCSTK